MNKEVVELFENAMDAVAHSLCEHAESWRTGMAIEKTGNLAGGHESMLENFSSGGNQISSIQR